MNNSFPLIIIVFIINEDPKNMIVKDDEDDDDEWETVIHSSDEEEEKSSAKEFLSLDEKAAKASEVTLGKVLTDEDFKRIDAAQLKKQVQGVRKGSKTPQKGKKRTADDAELDEDLTPAGRDELVRLEDIELIHKKRKHDKEARLETVMRGREDS